jgi:hypothetical protein
VCRPGTGRGHLPADSPDSPLVGRDPTPIYVHAPVSHDALDRGEHDADRDVENGAVESHEQRARTTTLRPRQGRRP